MTKRSWTALDSLRAALGLEPPGDIDQRTRPKVLAPDEPPPADEKPKAPATPAKAVGSRGIQPRTPTPDELLRNALH